jgi:methionyl-tRNA synthetase
VAVRVGPDALYDKDEKLMSSFYISTPIYYVNGAPHIGHAYTTIVADMMARFARQDGRDVFFMTGTDEHGLKIQRAAESQGITPQEMVDMNSAKFRELFEKLELKYDRFIRTTEDAHKQVVTEVVNRMKANDDVYLSKYEGWYSASDEAYYDESEIEDGKAIASGSPVEWVEESSYFFRLSKYQEPLLEWYKGDPNTVRPEARYNEVVSFVEGGLKDLSISRTTFSWGIPMPDDPDHVLYVWVDALTNYITGVGAFTDQERYDRYWPCDIHLIGKDILRFHAVYWPAFLMSAGLQPPKQVFAHGWWMNEGEKMSKSKGNFIDAFALADEYDLDVLRYYMMREVPLGRDGNFAKGRLIERNNSELADNVGNLVNRAFKMATGFLGGTLPAFVETSAEEDVHLRSRASETVEKAREAINKMQLHHALEVIMAFSSDLNQYIHKMEPWKLNKEGNKERVAEVLYHTLEGIRYVALLLHPFLPGATQKIANALGMEEADWQWSTLETWGQLPEGRTIKKPEILFVKHELPEEKAEREAKAAKQKSKKQPKQKSKKQESKDDKGYATFDDFLKVELHVVKILSAERVEGSDKLLKLSIDAGEPEPRSVAAGIAQAFAPEDIVGWHVAAVTNLKPRKIFGIPSQAMLLAVDTTDGKLELARYSENAAPGTRIQ